MRVEAGGRLSDVAYEQLRNLIIQLEIEPGAPIDELRVSQQIGVGLTPVRDALKRLTHDRLVAIYPRRGTFASDINIADVHWIGEVRIELEGLGAALAAERATDDQKAALFDMASKIQKVSNILEFGGLDAAFHRTVHAASHNPMLEANLGQYLNLALRIWNYRVRNFSVENIAGEDFLLLATAITESNPAKAREAMRKHVVYSRMWVKDGGQ